MAGVACSPGLSKFEVLLQFSLTFPGRNGLSSLFCSVAVRGLVVVVVVVETGEFVRPTVPRLSRGLVGWSVL